MRLGIRTKQVAGVTAVVALAATVLFVWYLTSLAHVLLEGSRSNAHVLSSAVYHRLFAVISRGGDPATEIAADEALRQILQTGADAESVEYVRHRRSAGQYRGRRRSVAHRPSPRAAGQPR